MWSLCKDQRHIASRSEGHIASRSEGHIASGSAGHMWIKEDHCRNVCIQCGLVDRYPYRDTSINDISNNKRFINQHKSRDATRDKSRKFGIVMSSGPRSDTNIVVFEKYYDKFCTFLGQKNINGVNFHKFTTFIKILTSFS